MSAPLVNKMESKQLQFVAFNSFLDSGFWHKLSENKLDVYGLDESQKEIKGFYFNGNTLIILYNIQTPSYSGLLSIVQKFNCVSSEI